MSEKPISSLSLPEMLVLRKKPDSLTGFQIAFLLDWHEINKPKMFGFQGIRSLEDQLRRAIVFLKEIERDWESRARNNQTSLQFYQFFFYSAVSRGIQVVSDFEDRYLQSIKGDKK